MVLVDYYKNNVMRELFPEQYKYDDNSFIHVLSCTMTFDGETCDIIKDGKDIQLNQSYKKIKKERRRYNIKKISRNIKKGFIYVFGNPIYQAYLAGYAVGMSFYFFSLKLLYANIAASILIISGFALFMCSLVNFYKNN